jgi:hypothetical protein
MALGNAKNARASTPSHEFYGPGVLSESLFVIDGYLDCTDSRLVLINEDQVLCRVPIKIKVTRP